MISLRRRKRVYLDNLPKTHDLRFFVVFLVVLVAVFAGLYGVGYLVAGDKVPAGTTVAGVDVGTMSRGEARTALQEELAPKLHEPIAVVVQQRRFPVNPQRAGLTFDLDATLDEALGGGDWDPRHMLKVVFGGSDVDPVVVVDDDDLRAALDRIDAKVRVRPVDARVRFPRAQPVVKAGRVGQALDPTEFRTALSAALATEQDRATVGLVAVQPRISTQEATRFVDRTARPAVRSKIRIRVADGAITLTPDEFGPALRSRVVDGRLRLGVSPEAIMKRAGPDLRRLPHQPVDARIVFRDGQPRIARGQAGVTVTPDGLADAVRTAVSRRGSKRVATAPARAMQPEVTVKDVRALGIQQLLGKASHRFPASTAAAVRRIVGRLDGDLVRPQASLSLLRQTGGPPDERAGSLVASTTYAAALRAGLSEIERSPHRTYREAFAEGFDARLGAGSDLVVGNDSPNHVYLRAYVTAARGGAGTVHVEWWGTRHWQVQNRTSGRSDVVRPPTRASAARSCRPHPGAPGFDVVVSRSFSRGGKVVRTDTHRSHYAPVPRIVCRRG